MPYLTNQDKNTLSQTWGHDRPLNPMEQMVINNTNAASLVEYRMRQRHTFELIRQRAQRQGITMETKLLGHLQLQLTNLLNQALEDNSADSLNIDLDRMIASILAIKVIVAEEQVRAMMGG